MRTRPHFRPMPTSLVHFTRAALGAALLALTACQSDRPTALRLADDAEQTKVQSTGGGAGSTLSVTSTTPASAPQDTTLDVHIFGTGFAKGAKASWALNGDTTKVHVNSTKLIGSTELIANVNVPSTASIANYDVVVTLATGKKGIGAELFAVTLGNTTATWAFPLADARLSVRSDRQYSDGTYSLYADGVCTVSSTIFVTGTGDNTIGFSYPKSGHGSCGRTWTLSYPDGFSETLSFGGGVQILQNGSYSVPVGNTARRHFRIGTSVINNTNPTKPRCSQGLVFGPGGANPAVGSDSINVTRVDASTWRVKSQPAPNDHAYCIDNGLLYQLQLDFLIISARALP